MSYCIDRPSLVLGLVLRDKTRDALGGNRIGLPFESAKSERYLGGVMGIEGDAAALARASTKGASGYLVAASWERLRVSASVTEVCVDKGCEVSGGSLLAVAAACG
jgi:hypothetical protein